MPPFNKGWYLLYTSPKQEKKVAEQLSNVKIENYLPLIKVARKWTDRVKLIKQPLFPCYIFVHLGHLQDYYISLHTRGVLHYVKFNNQIASVSDLIIKNLKLIVNAEQPIEVLMMRFQQGQLLNIIEGPLTGLNCEMIKYKNRQMVMVRISLINRSILLELPAIHLSGK